MMTQLKNTITGTQTMTETSSNLTKNEDILTVKETPREIREEIVNNKDFFLEQLNQVDFYTQLLVIAATLLLSGATAWHLRRKINQYIEQKNSSHSRRQLLKFVVPLFFPLLNILLLLLAKPILDQFSIKENAAQLSNAAIDLAVAYFFARLVMIVVQAKPVARFLASVIILAAILKVTAFTRVTKSYLDSIAFDLGSVHISVLGLFNGLVILTVVIWVSMTLTKWLENYLLRKSTLSYAARELTVKFFRVMFYIIAIVMTLSAMGVDLTAFAVFGGALGVGIGLGLQKITSNFVGGITLLLEKSIKIGDLIEFSGATGWVRRLNIRYALIETFDGKEMIVPNEELVSNTVTNWSYSTTKARVDINIGVAYGSDLRKVQEILIESAKKHERCIEDPAPNCFLREFADSSINFVLMFWVQDVNEGRWGPQSDVMLTIWDRFGEEGIEIPFPQRVIHHASDLVIKNKARTSDDAQEQDEQTKESGNE